MPHNIWHKLLAPDNQTFEIVLSEELDDVISILVDAQIDPKTFGGNLCELLSEGLPSFSSIFDLEQRSLPTSPSVKKYTSVINRPVAVPLWFIAAFPDVLHWLNESQAKIHRCASSEDTSVKEFDELLGLNMNQADDVDISQYQNRKGQLRSQYYRNLVHNYLKRTGARLEVAVVPGSETDMYTAMDMLHAVGEESTFTLIATMTTKYYSELRNNYSASFPDETSLLAMAGILDANMSIFVTQQITIEQVIDLARRSGGNNRYFDFLISLSTLLIWVDAQEMDPSDITAAGLEQADKIQESIRYALNTYKSEPMISQTARMVMRAPQFAYVRQAVGVTSNSLFSKIKKLFGQQRMVQ